MGTIDRYVAYAAAFEEALKQSHPVRSDIPTLPAELNVIG